MAEEVRLNSMVPKRMFFTKGMGIHRNKLQSFELALREAGIEIGDDQFFFKRLAAPDDLACLIDDQAAPIEDQFVLAADHIRVRHDHLIVPRSRGKHAFPRSALAYMERRRVDFDDDYSPRSGQRVGRPVMKPDVFANINSNIDFI